MAKKTYNQQWVLTDGDTNQYGRRLTEHLFEFKEDGKETTIIDLSKGTYTNKEIEHCINAYGYTLLSGELKVKSLQNIHEQYGKDANWIIAECLFEQDAEIILE